MKPESPNPGASEIGRCESASELIPLTWGFSLAISHAFFAAGQLICCLCFLGSDCSVGAPRWHGDAAAGRSRLLRALLPMVSISGGLANVRHDLARFLIHNF